MIRAFNKDGKEVDVSKLTNTEDQDVSGIGTQVLPLLAGISQVVKEIVTRLEFEDDGFRFVIEQK